MPVAFHFALFARFARFGHSVSRDAVAGSWSLSLSSISPFSDLVAIDNDWSVFRAAPSPHGNIDFVTVALDEDVLAPLPFEANWFDVIHVQSMLLEIPNYASLVERLAVLLQPEGMIVLVEAEPRFLSSIGETSYLMRQWEACVRDAMAAQQIDVNVPANLTGIVTATGIFDPPQGQEAYISVAGHQRGGPLTLARTGKLHPQVIAGSLRSLIPALLAHRYDPTELETLLSACLVEVR
ncbi:hypothetical protein EHS25_004461 [Saitozyma podzolica]|uniref:Methyltransferase type 11 domain-containing protein n=1 Tax=Saitozyma podzolica TaxID=1890683 RepID=A0A427YUE1_9TREE|nr:hypothetical protein EHS25_004461 [Saitozyma podzolica]